LLPARLSLPSQDDPSCTWQIAESGQILTRRARANAAEALNGNVRRMLIIFTKAAAPSVGLGVMGLICLLASLPWLLFPTRFFTRYNANRIFIIEQTHSPTRALLHTAAREQSPMSLVIIIIFQNTHIALCRRTAASAVSISKRKFLNNAL